MFVADANDRPFVSELLRNLFVAASFMLLVAVYFFFKRFPGWLRSFVSADWPTAEGKVENVTVSTFSDQSLGEVAYSYVAEGERFSGYFSQQFADEQDAWDCLGPLKGQSIFLRYKPSNPKVSAVRITEQNHLFVARQQNFARRFLRRLVLSLFGEFDWQQLTIFAARSWPTAKGRVESGTVNQHRARGLWYLFSFYTAEINYSYVADGEYLSGYVERTFFRESSAHKFVEELKDKDVFIRYRRSSPNISILRSQDQRNMQLA